MSRTSDESSRLITLEMTHLPRFARVRWVGHGPDRRRRQGDGGIIWIDSAPPREGRALRVFYVVELDDGLDVCAPSEHLTALAEPARPEAHLGTTPQIHHDLVLGDGPHPYHEGTYRLPGRYWEVFTVLPSDEFDRVNVRRCSWHSGITGIEIRIPAGAPCSVAEVEALLADAVGVTAWTRTRGPDSMWLR
jgi:hypothetical protein